MSQPERQGGIDLRRGGHPYDIPAFRIIDDIYYVGEYVSSHLITSNEGHILIDTINPDSGPFILKGILDLGFDPLDIKYILITHFHFDHTGSAAMLAKLTGAKVAIGELDAEPAEKGTTLPGMDPLPPLKIDMRLKDGDVITLGDKEIHVYHTPGHTAGNISFGWKTTHKGRKLDVFLDGGFAIGGPGGEVKGAYEGAWEDYKKTVEKLESLNVDVWLQSHPEPNDTFSKFELQRRGVEPSPFIDPEGWKAFVGILRDSLAKGKGVGPLTFPLYTRQRPYFLKT